MSGSGVDCFLQDLPDDVLALVSASMHFRDLLNLSFTCKKFRLLCASDKLWIPHCSGIVSSWPAVHLTEWCKVVSSCKALFRFLISVKSLVGIWVHQNPELGNMVYITWGFVSVVACRIIPQEMGPNGLDTGLLWAPVFEIVGNEDGTQAFFLHGREREKDYFCPGRFTAVKEEPNVLLLEVEPLLHNLSSLSTLEFPDMRLSTMVDHSDDSAGEDVKVFCKVRGCKAKKKAAIVDPLPFHRLAFGDRRKLLEVLATQVRVKVSQSAKGPLFSSFRKKLPLIDTKSPQIAASRSLSNGDIHKELSRMAERRSIMLSMYIRTAQEGFHSKTVESASLVRSVCSSGEGLNGVKILEANDRPMASYQSQTSTGHSALPPQAVDGKSHSDSLKRFGFAKFVRTKMKQIIGKTTDEEHSRTTPPRNSEMKRLQLQEFLKQGHAVGLRLHATSWRLNFYRAWPIMHDNRFALYKIPEQNPTEGREHAGLWGGTFGWPPGLPVQDKLGTPLFFLLLSYDETEEGQLLIATKILEGTHYVLHPNGSAMFTAKIKEPSAEQFPYDKNSDGDLLDIVQSYQGEGIASGYGFRYPGSKPGDLFVLGNGILAFVWRESRSVLSLQRMNLQSLLEKGERVAPLSPISNFAYLTKSFSNVFAGYCGLTATSARTKSCETHK